MARNEQDTAAIRAARAAWAAKEKARVARQGSGGTPAPFNFQGKKISIGDERHPNFVGPKKPKEVGDMIGGKGGMKIIGIKRQKRAAGGRIRRVRAKSGGRIKRAKVLSRGKR